MYSQIGRSYYVTLEEHVSFRAVARGFTNREILYMTLEPRFFKEVSPWNP